MGMKKITVGVYTCLHRTCLLVVLFDKKVSAFRTLRISRLEVRDEITVGIVRTPVEFLPLTAGFLAGYYLAVATFPRAVCQGYSLGIAAFGKPRAGEGRIRNGRASSPSVRRIFRRPRPVGSSSTPLIDSIVSLTCSTCCLKGV